MPSKGEFLDFPKKDSGFIFQGLDKLKTEISASDFSLIVPLLRFKIFDGFIVKSSSAFSIFIYLFFTRFKVRGNKSF